MVSMETVRQQLDELLTQTEQDCAEAMEAATARAAEQVRAERAALIALGRQQERERTLMAIALVGAQLRSRAPTRRRSPRSAGTCWATTDGPMQNLTL